MKYLISPLLWTLHKIFGLTHPNNCSVTGGFRKWNTPCGILKVQGYVCGAPCVFVNAVITIGISLCSCVIVSVSHSVYVDIVLLCTLFTWFGAYQSMQLQNLEHCWTSEHLVSRSGFVLSNVSGLGISVQRTCLPLTCGCFSVSCLFTRVWWVWIHTSITLAFNQI